MLPAAAISPFLACQGSAEAQDGASGSPGAQPPGGAQQQRLPQLRIRTTDLEQVQQHPAASQHQHQHQHQQTGTQASMQQQPQQRHQHAPAVELSDVRQQQQQHAAPRHPHSHTQHSSHHQHSGSVSSATLDMDWDALSSSDTEDGLGLLASPPGAADWGAGAGAGGSGAHSGNSTQQQQQQQQQQRRRRGSGAFEPFEVEEQSGTELRYLRQAYAKKEAECEHLRTIIKELSVSRSRAQQAKVELEEQFNMLQKEYYKVLKVSDLARTVKQEAVSRASTLRSELSAAQDQARRSRRRAAAAEARCAALSEENGRLKSRMALVEGLVGVDGSGPGLGGDGSCGGFGALLLRPSACAREFLVSASLSLY